MPTDKELMQQALASLEGYARNCRCEGSGGLCDAGKAIKARLSQPEPKPACWLYKGVARLSPNDSPPEETIPLYTAPPQREWQNAALRVGEELSSVGPDWYYEMSAVQWLDWAMAQNPKGKTSLPQREWQGLTDEQIDKLPWGPHEGNPMTFAEGLRDFARAIEAKLREKNASNL